MKKFYTAVLVVIMLLTLTGSVIAVGSDCTDPPNLVPFADLTDCDLSGMDMEGVNIWSADLSGANVSDANLSDALLEGVDFTGANATGAIFDEADLFTTILDDAIFDNASLRNTLMEDAHAHRASFINADFRGADLYFTHFNNANLSGANISNMWLNAFDLPGATLQNTNFSGSSMRSMNMRDTDLRGADLSLAELLFVNFSNADLRDATLLGAERGTGVNFTGVIWGNTTCADGSNSDDDDGDGFTCLSNFLDNMPPTITLLSPAQGETFAHGETITISAEAADSDGSISRFEFYANDTFFGYGLGDPAIFEWTDAPAGTHEIRVIVFDDDGASASQSATITVEAAPNNQPPTVAITAPHNNATVYRWWGTWIKADAADPDGTITKVEFYVDGTLVNTDTSAPYNYYWYPSSRGYKTLTVIAYDDGGAETTSDPITVRAR